MPSNHTGDPATFNDPISFPTDGDPKHITPIRSALDLLLDNDAYLKDQRARNELRAAALKFRPLVLSDTLDDTADFMGAAQHLAKPYETVVLVKAGTNDVFSLVSGESRAGVAGGDVPSITAAVREAASNGARIVVIGTGGNLNAYTDNEGASFSAGTAGIGGAVQYLVWSPANALTGGGARFYSGGSGTGSVYETVNPASIVWTSIASAFAAVNGLAVLGGTSVDKGYVVSLGVSAVLGHVGEPAFSVLVDGGNGADFNGFQSPPNAATADEVGSIAGAPAVPVIGAAVYHVMRCDSGLRMRTAKSTDGSNWTAATQIEAPSGVLFTGAPRLMICQNSGLQVIAVPCDAAGGSVSVYASRDFTTWIGPEIVYAGDVGAFAVSGGRVFFTQGAQIMATDGLGAGDVV